VETLIEQMSRDQDPIIRYGAMFVVGLAYRGTANNGPQPHARNCTLCQTVLRSKAIKKLASCLASWLCCASLHVRLRLPGLLLLLHASTSTSMRAGAIQKLLHFAVSDVSDDVRRAAVINLGFVLLNVPEQTPRIVSLLVGNLILVLMYAALHSTAPPSSRRARNSCLLTSSSGIIMQAVICR